METAKKSITLTAILWIIFGVFLIVFGSFMLSNPKYASLAPGGIGAGIGLILVSIIVLQAIKYTEKKWAQIVIYILTICGWLVEIFGFIAYKKIDVAGLILFIVPMTFISYMLRKQQIANTF